MLNLPTILLCSLFSISAPLPPLHLLHSIYFFLAPSLRLLSTSLDLLCVIIDGHRDRRGTATDGAPQPTGHRDRRAPQLTGTAADGHRDQRAPRPMGTATVGGRHGPRLYPFLISHSILYRQDGSFRFFSCSSSPSPIYITQQETSSRFQDVTSAAARALDYYRSAQEGGDVLRFSTAPTARRRLLAL